MSESQSGKDSPPSSSKSQDSLVFGGPWNGTIRAVGTRTPKFGLTEVIAVGFNFKTVQGLTRVEKDRLNKAMQRAMEVPHPSSLPEEQREQAQQEWDKALYEWRRADPSDFRLNSVGFGWITEKMIKFGMVEVGVKAPAFPAPSDFGLTDHPDTLDEREPGDHPTESEKRFLEARDAVLNWDSGSGVIPLYKLDDDPWVITPREIQEALKAYEQAPAKEEVEEHQDIWENFIRFLQGAVHRQGMSV